MNLRLCQLVEHQSQNISFINLDPKATQRLACGLCYFESQNKQYYIKISELPQQISTLLGTYSKYEETITSSQPILKKMVEQLDMSMQNLKSYSLNQQQKIRSEFNNTQQRLKQIAECQPYLLTEDDIQYYYQIQKDNSQLDIKMNQNLEDFDQLIQIFQNQIDIIDSIIQPMTSITEIEKKLIQQFQLNDLISNQMKIQLQDIFQDQDVQMKTIKITKNQEYIGSYNNNQPDGFGSLIDSEINFYYKGVWDKGQFKYGMKVDLQNQQLFKGNFQLSELNIYEINGDGYFINQVGDIYEGHFENDVFTCQGTMKYAHQASYQGQWLLGNYEGEGHYEDKNKIYHGEFSDGLFEGQGTLEDLQAKSVYKGRFQKGEYNGKGTLILQDPKVKYKGMFSDNKLHGYAKEIIEINENKQEEEEEEGEIDITKSLFRSLTKKPIANNEPKKIKQVTEGEYINGYKNDIHNQYTVINKIKQKKILNILYCQGEQICVEEQQ